MPVKRAMRKAGGIHDLRHGDAFKAALAKQACCSIENARAVFGNLFAAYLHDLSF